MGTTDKTGRFSLMSFEPGDGAKPGEYIATVMKMETRGEIHIFRPEGTNQKIVQDEREIIHHLPQQYACPSSTHLKITIPGNGDSNLVIDLTGEADLTPRQAKTMDRRIDPRDWGT